MPESRTPPAPLRVVIVEDDARYRDGLRALFAHAPGFSLASAFVSGSDAVAAWRPDAPWDLVFTDIDMPGITGIEATRFFKTRRPDLHVVMLTVFEDPATILAAICAGADGYLLKRASPEELLQYATMVAAGGASLTAGVARTVLELVRRSSARSPLPGAAADLGLSPREIDVLRGLVQGQAYKQIAGTLDISIDTVRTHVRGVYRKLQVHSVAEAVGRAIREGLV